MSYIVKFNNNQINTLICVTAYRLLQSPQQRVLCFISYFQEHVPFSQFRRAVVLCSTTQSRDAHFARIYDKLVDNGYYKEELLEARERALTLARSDIRDNGPSSRSSTPTSMYLSSFYVSSHLFQHSTIIASCFRRYSKISGMTCSL